MFAEVEMPDEEAELLRLLQEAFGPGLRRFVMRLTADGMLADDVVQETLIRAWQHPAVLQRPEPAVRAWLFTVARHLVIDDRRSARMRHEAGADPLPEIPAADQIDRVLDGWLVADALAGLSAEHREVILHSYYQRETTAEIAQSLQLAEGTVKSRLHYGLRALRLALQERGVTR
jgi:RNA polymerase sigma-70 factor (ECF subfamily)